MSLKKIAPLCCLLTLLSACQHSEEPTAQSSKHLLDSKHLSRLIPARTHNRTAWAHDIQSIMRELSIEPNIQNSCAIVAVVDQESNFAADPVVAGLGKKAIKEIHERVEKKLGTKMAGIFDNMLKKYPTPEHNFLMQLEQVKTERELDQLYRNIYVFYAKKYNVHLLSTAAKLIVRQDLAENFNPVKTLGSMQVHIRYAREHARMRGNVNAIRDDIYTQYGGLYYGIHRLMSYPAAYDQPLYRFADYNSGMYSSRNASFQQALGKLSGESISLDGDLLMYDKDGDALNKNSATELALNAFMLAERINLSPIQVRKDLLKEKQAQFEHTETYQAITQLYRLKLNKNFPYAIMPQVVISGPKLSRDYNTNWFASRVNQRYTRCLRTGRQMGFRTARG